MGFTSQEDLLILETPNSQDLDFRQFVEDPVRLSDPDSSFQIEYRRDAMEQIRKRSWEALMSFPRVGIGVGGLLLGVREHGCVRLLGSVDLPCSHSIGPSFNLTADEILESREMIVEAGEPGVSSTMGVIGWYCSKTRGTPTLSESDLELYGKLFPDSWQIAMVVRPSAVEPMRTAFFFRDENGAAVKGIECAVNEWRPAAKPADDPEVRGSEPEIEAGVLFEIAAASVPKVVEMPKPAKSTGVAGNGLSDLVNLSSSVARSFAVEPPIGPRVPFDVPDPGPEIHPREGGKLGWVMAGALTVGVLAKWWAISGSSLRGRPGAR